MAMKALESDALEPGAQAEAHLRACAACREAQVMLLAQEEAPLPLVQAGYFERLPARVIGKLQTRKVGLQPGAWWMAAAAVFTLAVGTGAFMAGRANRTPLVQAEVRPVEPIAPIEAPFTDSQDELGKLQNLKPEEVRDLLKQLQTDPPKQGNE
jgi:anti-sigma-K factor RskA